MERMAVRLESLVIQNFNNVKYGKLSFENPKKNYAASILGLYGQNGSGKTTVIDCISLLKYALSGQVIPATIINHINVDSEFAKMHYELKVYNASKEYHVVYEFNLKKEKDFSQKNNEILGLESENYKVKIYNEVLSYSCHCNNGKTKILPVIDTRNSESFGPESKLEILTNGNKNVITDLIVAKKVADATSRSYCFSRELLSIIRNNCKDDYHLNMLENLVRYGNYELFIITTSNLGLISLDALPITFSYKEKNSNSLGKIALPLSINNESVISEDVYKIALKLISNMNIVLKTIVPGLTIGIKNLGNKTLEDGTTGIQVELVSLKNNKEIPLRYESEGIKKIISILQLLIVVYNESSITVAIDELDSGVFEYLLGELLKIISENGKGQLIFTSHNLRPLETLDKGFIAFTTTNPQNRYIRLTRVKSNNNLRNFYYRDIVLGEQSEEVYEHTNNIDINNAFIEAGDVSVS